MRKVIQIAVAPETENRSTLLYSLCDDGTVWFISHDTNGFLYWEQVPKVPQDLNIYEP